MLKITKMLTVVLAVSALAVSATPAMGAVNWDGGGDGVNWSDNGEFSGDGWGNWDADPTTAGLDLNLQSATATTSTVDIDMTDPAVWANVPTNINPGSGHVITVPAGGVISQGYYLRLHGDTTLRLDGGTLALAGWKNINMAGGGNLELLGGTWNHGAGGPGDTYTHAYKPGHIHVKGLTPGYDFSPDYLIWEIGPTTVDFTMEAGEGIATITCIDPNVVIRSALLPVGSVPLNVHGIQDYLDAGGTQLEWDLITSPATGPNTNMTAFASGLVDGGLGEVTVTESAVTLTILAVVGVPGDLSGDGDVDTEDVGLFELQFGSQPHGPVPGPPYTADFDEDDDVDLHDFLVMRDYLGTGVGAAPAVAATPEPATMTVLALGGLMVLRRRRH